MRVGLAEVGALALAFAATPVVGACDTGGAVVCDDGYHVSGDRCIPIPVDGAMDAGGGGDAAMVDAGRSDGSGADAGSPDAGPCGGACSGDTPHCDEGSDSCVACLETGHCGGDTPHCEPTTHTCVACLEHADCTDPAAAQCDDATHACVACDDSGQCGGITGTEVCADTGPNMGECVECTEAEDAVCATDHPCNPRSNVCSAFERDSRSTCESCDTDTNCTGATSRCVRMNYMGTMRGGYCLEEAAGGRCSTRPFGTITTARSLSGETESDYCGIRQDLTTCEAVRAAVGGQECTMTMTPADCASEGARCETIGAFDNQCTYSCAERTECPSGDTCLAGGYCDLL